MTQVVRLLAIVGSLCVAAGAVGAADRVPQNGNTGEGPMSTPGPEAGFCVEVKPVCPPGGAAVCICDIYNMCHWTCGAQ